MNADVENQPIQSPTLTFCWCDCCICTSRNSKVYGGLLFLYAAAVGLIQGGLAAVPYMILIPIIVGAIIYFSVKTFPVVKIDHGELIAQKPKTERLYCLDNIKSFLTFMVVIHHILCMFVGSGWYVGIANNRNWFRIFQIILTYNQSYFMCMFFFISAYFTPMSFDKKGTMLFLQDKFKRLGIPFIVFLFIVGPLHASFCHYAYLGRRDGYSYMIDAGPTWFLCWLLIFNTVYTLLDGNSPKMPFPSLTTIFMWGFILVVIQLACMLMTPGSFLFMPITIGSFPYDIAFFIAGVWARRNDWLQTIFNLSFGNVTYLYSVTAIMMLIMFAVQTGQYFTDNLDFTKGDGPIYGAIILLCSGLFCVGFSASMIHYFYIHWNQSGPWLKFFARNSYAVYLIHPLFITPLAWTWNLILENAFNYDIHFPEDKTASENEIPAYLLLIGWIYTMILTNLLLWPCAHYFRQLPGVRKLL